MKEREEKAYPKVLVMTRNAWNDNNCTGNTLSNFFAGWPKSRIANAFFRAEKIDNSVCERYYRVTEQELVRSVFHKSGFVGGKLTYVPQTETKHVTDNEEDVAQSKNLYGFFSRHRWVLALWARDILWSLGAWKNTSFDEFLTEFAPDVIYMPCYDSVYMHRILWYVKKKIGARIVLFTGDDTYTLKQFNLSPLFWINRFIDRRTMRKSVKAADTLFVISDLQKQEYDRIFKRDCVILRKGGNFDVAFSPKASYEKPLRLVYTGNIHSGRWKTLALLASAIREINADAPKLQMDIYTLSARDDTIIQALNIEGCSRIMPPATNEEISQALQDADVLVFVEPFELKEKLKWRLSFSTKIVDYLASSRAVLAIGPKGLSSMDYLQRNDAAICINDRAKIKEHLEALVENPELAHEFAQKAWDCGKKNNSIEKTRDLLFARLVGGENDF